MTAKGLAVVTGASTGIGLELARCAARGGYSMLICADEAEIETAAAKLREEEGAEVEAVVADLSTRPRVEAFIATIGERPVNLLMGNAGIGLGDAFLDQSILRALDVVNTNVGGTLVLVHGIGRRIRSAGRGRILITGSIAGFLPGSYAAVYNGTKAFLDGFSYALRDELADHGVTVTCLMPGATETAFFRRASMLDTNVGRQDKADPARVARTGFKAMMAGDSGVVTGFGNKLRAALAGVLPETLLARRHRNMAQPRE